MVEARTYPPLDGLAAPSTLSQSRTESAVLCWPLAGMNRPPACSGWRARRKASHTVRASQTHGTRDGAAVPPAWLSRSGGEGDYVPVGVQAVGRVVAPGPPGQRRQLGRARGQRPVSGSGDGGSRCMSYRCHHLHQDDNALTTAGMSFRSQRQGDQGQDEQQHDGGCRD